MKAAAIPSDIMASFNRHAPQRQTLAITPRMFVELLRQNCGLHGIIDGNTLLQLFRDHSESLWIDEKRPVYYIHQLSEFMAAVMDLMRE